MSYGPSPGACSTAHRLNRLDHWDGLSNDRSAVGHFVLLDKDESCPTTDLSNIGCPNGLAYLTDVPFAETRSCKILLICFLAEWHKRRPEQERF